MTHFEEIQALVEKNKAKRKRSNEINLSEDSLGVPGITESGKSGNPHIEFATDESDMSIIEQLYRNPRNRPNDGSNATYWDPDY
jgi:hypothetical protein